MFLLRVHHKLWPGLQETENPECGSLRDDDIDVGV